MLKKVFVTTSVYALAHQVGMREAIDEVGRQLKAPSEAKVLPVVRTITRISHFAEVGLHIDAGATYLGMARSRAFDEAFRSDFPAWITLDDDIEATMPVVGAMLETLDDLQPRIIMVPYTLRAPGEEHRLAVNVPAVRVERMHGAIKLLALERGHGGGLGMVGFNRPAMKEIANYCPPELAWVDSDGVQKRALFYERVEDMLWFGEDVSFFRWRVPPTVSVELLLAGVVSHAGIPLDLATI